MERIKVYFKNENDAFSAQTELNKYKVNEVSMEKVEEGSRFGNFFPVVPPYWGGGSGSAGGVFPSLTSNSSTEEEEAKSADPKYMSYLLSFEVKEADYEEVMTVLEKYEPYGLNTDDNQ